MSSDNIKPDLNPELLRRRARADKRMELMRRRRRQLVIRRRITFAAIVLGLAAVICIFGIIPAAKKASSSKADGSETAADTEGAYGDSVISAISDDDPAAFPDQAMEEEPERDPMFLPDTGDGTVFSAVFKDSTQYLADEQVQSGYAILIDADNREVVLQREGQAVVSPASMTKILTLLVAVEHITDLHDTFIMTEEITNYSYSHGCSNVGFSIGEEITVEDMLYGTILESGGDAALGLAYYTAGSQEAFVEWMNEKLDEFGLSSTAHFTNCIGLFDDDHHCTMYDMAVILAETIKYPLCRQIMNTRTYTTSATEYHPAGIEISNWFLRRIEDKDSHGEILYAKTGFVNQSGSCAASYYESVSGRHYICVTGNAWSAWRCIYDQVEIYSVFTE